MFSFFFKAFSSASACNSAVFASASAFLVFAFSAFSCSLAILASDSALASAAFASAFLALASSTFSLAAFIFSSDSVKVLFVASFIIAALCTLSVIVSVFKSFAFVPVISILLKLSILGVAVSVRLLTVSVFKFSKPVVSCIVVPTPSAFVVTFSIVSFTLVTVLASVS